MGTHLWWYVLFVSSTLHLVAAGTDTYGLGIRLGVVVLTGAVAPRTIAALIDAFGRDEVLEPTRLAGAPPGSADWVHRSPSRPPYADVAR